MYEICREYPHIWKHSRPKGRDAIHRIADSTKEQEKAEFARIHVLHFTILIANPRQNVSVIKQKKRRINVT